MKRDLGISPRVLSIRLSSAFSNVIPIGTVLMENDLWEFYYKRTPGTKLDHRDRLICTKLVEHWRNGGTSARQISAEVPGAGAPSTVERHLQSLKADGWANQATNGKWIPGPKLTRRWERMVAKELPKTHMAIPITGITREALKELEKLLVD